MRMTGYFKNLFSFSLLPVAVLHTILLALENVQIITMMVLNILRRSFRVSCMFSLPHRKIEVLHAELTCSALPCSETRM